MPFYSKVFDLFRGQPVYTSEKMKQLQKEKESIKKEIETLYKKKEKLKQEQRKLNEVKG